MPPRKIVTIKPVKNNIERRPIWKAPQLPKQILRIPDDHSLCLREIADIFQRAPNTVWEAVRDNRLKAYKSGYITLVTKRDLIAAFDAGTFPGKRGPKPRI